MARSLLRQLEQIRRSATYDDAVANVNTSAVAEPTVSGSLEDDMNVVRTLIKDLKGTTNWFDSLGTYFDPTATASGKELSLNNISGNTLDSKTVIIAVTDNNSGSGYAVTTASSGVLVSTATQYATSDDRRGLPIYSSATGTYYDEGGDLRVTRIDVIDTSNDTEIQDGSGNIVYGLFKDGLDAGGSGDGTDVFVEFYANGSPITMVSGVSNVEFIYPQRKVMSEMNEYDWMRTDFVNSWEGDVELAEDISNLWSFTGASDGDTSPQPWNNTGNYYMLSSDPSDLKSAVDLINDGVGDRTYTEANYVTDGEAITSSLDILDQELQDLADSISAASGDKYVESVSGAISAGSLHSLPYGISYTPDATAGQEGKNMDVYVDGQLLAADTGANGANADRDYGETTASGITFRFNIQVGRNITYIVRQ